MPSQTCYQNKNIFPNTLSSCVKKKAPFLLVWNLETKTMLFL